MGPKGAHEGAAPLPLRKGLGFGRKGPTWGAAPPFGRRPPSSLPPIYSGGLGGGEYTAKAQPPLLSPTAFSPSHVATPPPSCDSHAWSCTCRWSCTIRTPSCCRCVGPNEIFFRKPRLDRRRRTSSLPDVYEYSGTRVR